MTTVALATAYTSGDPSDWVTLPAPWAAWRLQVGSDTVYDSNTVAITLGC